jgi:hypothetical protein
MRISKVRRRRTESDRKRLRRKIKRRRSALSTYISKIKFHWLSGRFGFEQLDNAIERGLVGYKIPNPELSENEVEEILQSILVSKQEFIAASVVES